MSFPNEIISVSHVSKMFKQGTNLFDKLSSFSHHHSKIVTALIDVSFSVKKGEVVAILGKNGAGKTTLLKSLTSLLIPDKGNIHINGHNINTDLYDFKKDIGLMSNEERGFYYRLSIRGNLEFFASLYDMGQREATDRINQLCDYFTIPDPEKRFQECSTGVKQKCSLARSLLHNPEILYMDEPTRSLDPVSALQIRTFIVQLSKNEGKTILFATHNTMEAEKVADTIMILDRGKLTAMGRLRDLRKDYVEENSDLDQIFSKIVGKKKHL